jgi:hypothetical protein
MRSKRVIVPAVAVAMIAGAWGLLAQQPVPQPSEAAQHHSPQQGQAEQHDMREMMAMCRQMMMQEGRAGMMRGAGEPRVGGGGGGGGGAMMMRLPPGNEALELQMQAEMMRAMAQVMEKYAGRIRQAEAPDASMPDGPQ